MKTQQDGEKITSTVFLNLYKVMQSHKVAKTHFFRAGFESSQQTKPNKISRHTLTNVLFSVSNSVPKIFKLMLEVREEEKDRAGERESERS